MSVASDNKARLGNIKEDGIVAYHSEVMHQRLRPFTYLFRYKIMGVCLDVDAFTSRTKPLSWLGFNRFQLMSIHTQDFGSRDGQGWREWITHLLADYGLTTPPARILLACMPRSLGYGFNPLAIWYAYDSNDELLAVVAEVSNTFGHFHHYVFTNHGNVIEQTSKTLNFRADKAFHVSPFMGMTCRYHFRIRPPSINEHTPYSVSIRETEDEQDTLIAVQKSTPIAQPSYYGLVRFGYWLSSFKTIAAIHWWALKIIFKGGRFRSTPEKQLQKPYGHSSLYLE